MTVTTKALFDVSGIDESLRFLLAVDKPWQVLNKLDEFLTSLEGSVKGYVHPSANNKWSGLFSKRS